jgi:Uma2 family endonuclease
MEGTMAEAAEATPTNLDAFLAWKERQGPRHERLGGVVRATTGGTVGHNTVIDNVLLPLRARLRGKPRQPWRADVKVIAPAGDVMYPDVVVSWSPQQRKGTSIDRPVLAVEVSSPGTEKYDITVKRWAYQSIPSLRHLVFLAQDEARAEVVSRNADGSWTSVFVDALEGSVPLPVLELSLPVA